MKKNKSVFLIWKGLLFNFTKSLSKNEFCSWKNLCMFIFSAFAILSLTGCATLNNMMVQGWNCPIFLNASAKELEQTEFFLDGKPVKWEMKKYEDVLTASSPTTNTYMVTYYPAIEANTNHKYYTLTIKNPQIIRKDILIKRELSQLANGFLFWDLFLSGGIGTLIDVFDNSLMRLPGVNMEFVVKQKSPYVFYNTNTITKLNTSTGVTNK